MIQEIYTYEWEKFDDEGLHVETRLYFMELVESFEKDFAGKHPGLYPTHLFGNTQTMQLFDKALNMDETMHCGFELIDGEVDIDSTIEMDNHGKSQTVFGIGSTLEGREGEPILLINDNSLYHDTIILKYLPDQDNDEEKNPVPNAFERKKVR